MYDFWFTLGITIMDPTFLPKIQKGKLPFKPLASRLIVEIDLAGQGTVLGTTNKTAGTLDPNTCDAFRQLISDNIDDAGAPPISIYAAGRLSQLLAVQSIGFLTSVDQAQQAFAATSEGSAYSAAFPAAIGLCLIDQRLANILVNSPGGELARRFFKEFDLTPDDIATLVSYLTNDAFSKAQNRLLLGDNTPWQDICPDQYLFWDPQNEHAII